MEYKIFDAISFRYGENYIFKDFSLDINSHLTIFKGPNGIGKSTLLKLACRILFPESGKVNTVSPSALILQEDALFPWLTVQENLSLVASNTSYNDKIPILFSKCKSILDERVYSLSYGQKRLVELCRVFGSSSKLICLDEPMNFLSPDIRILVATTVYELSGKSTIFLISSHHEDEWDPNNAAIYCLDRQEPIDELSQPEHIPILKRCEIQ